MINGTDGTNETNGTNITIWTNVLVPNYSRNYAMTIAMFTKVETSKVNCSYKKFWAKTPPPTPLPPSLKCAVVILLLWIPPQLLKSMEGKALSIIRPQLILVTIQYTGPQYRHQSATHKNSVINTLQCCHRLMGCSQNLNCFVLFCTSFCLENR